MVQHQLTARSKTSVPRREDWISGWGECLLTVATLQVSSADFAVLKGDVWYILTRKELLMN